jgi:acyl-coenzyme A synthetase/AMP-(fatty) acid ligase
MAHGDRRSLSESITAEGYRLDRYLWSAIASINLCDLVRGSALGGHLDGLRGRSVLVATREQLTTALALIELDGIARRLVICPPDVPFEHVAFVMEIAAVDALVSDRATPETGAASVACSVTCNPRIAPTDAERSPRHQTEWVLLTSGTTGRPKLVLHNLSSLAGAIEGGGTRSQGAWSTFYDIRRYGGLQIFLRALLGGRALVLSSAEESVGEFLIRAGARGVTHISGTPSHWRRALMSPFARRIKPQYVRLSGEIADQAILDNLRAFYREAKVAHAFASTEAGVAFDVDDGLAGFPARLITQEGADVEMKIENGSLRIRSARTAIRYLGCDQILADGDGFVDTGDLVELRGDRYHFVGRRDGTINVGGLKVHPEEVEAVINRHPSVQMSLVRARKNPVTGSVVIANVVVKPEHGCETAQALKSEILEACHRALARHKVPTAIHFTPSLDVAASGKLVRLDA